MAEVVLLLLLTGCKPVLTGSDRREEILACPLILKHNLTIRFRSVADWPENYRVELNGRVADACAPNVPEASRHLQVSQTPEGRVASSYFDATDGAISVRLIDQKSCADAADDEIMLEEFELQPEWESAGEFCSDPTAMIEL